VSELKEKRERGREGGAHLVLLVLGDEVVHVALGLRELHLVHALARVPERGREGGEYGGLSGFAARTGDHRHWPPISRSLMPPSHAHAEVCRWARD